MAYPTDLKDTEWNLIKDAFEPKTKRGSSHKHEKRDIVNAILYLIKGGIGWRLMPNDFPPWKTVYDHFSKWSKQGIWESVLDNTTSSIEKRLAGKPSRAMELLMLRV